MTRSPRSTRTLAVAVVAVLAASSVLGLSLLKSDADETSVYAYFRDASPLIVGNDVKMSGVKVGVIDSIKVENGQARVGLRLEKAAQPLHVRGERLLDVSDEPRLVLF